MSEGKTPPKEFQPVSADEGARMMRDAAKSFAASMAWTKDQSTVLKSHIAMLSPDESSFHIHLPRDFDIKKFLREILATATKECFFSISLMNANIFFKSVYAGLSEDTVQFHKPEKIFKVQRRKDLRVRIPGTHKLKITFDDPNDPFQRVEKSAFDLSAGGISFLVDPGEELLYKPGTRLQNVSFAVQGKVIQTECEVRHCQTVRIHAKNEIKVGLLYINMKVADSNLIASYVFDESRKYFVRYI